MGNKYQEQFNEWIDRNTRLEYWLLDQAVTDKGMVSRERMGIGILKHRGIGNLVEMEQPTGEVMVVTVTGTEVFDCCEQEVGGNGWTLQVGTLNGQTRIALRPTEFGF